MRAEKSANQRLWDAAASGDLDGLKKALEAGAKLKSKSDEGWTALMAAVIGRQEAAAKMLLDAGAEKEFADKSGRRSLMIAAGENDEKIMRRLLDAGADVEATDHDSWTALHWASVCGSAECIVELLRAGAKTTSKGGLLGDTPLMLAARGDGDAVCLRLLLEAGADPLARSRDGKLAQDCVKASGSDREERVELLMAWTRAAKEKGALEAARQAEPGSRRIGL